jgi:hypothetical protein
MDSTGHATLFRIRVDETLRGESEPVLDYHSAFVSGAPLAVCPGDSFLRVRVGDVLAIAFDAKLTEYPKPVTAVALVNRKPNEVERFLMPGVNHLSLSAVRSLAGLPSTDAQSAVRRIESMPSSIWLPLLTGLGAALSVLRRTRQRRVTLTDAD